ncbi:MAG TPA: 50S ribosomal protein L15 [Negativicutes bacterium]|nr:50S ribosomal protein L15 [Negativicutes bacterium]
MQIHQLQPKHQLKDRKVVGRGGKKGTYSGRGGKGQTARSGRKLAPIIRELIKRYPKLKGYRAFETQNHIRVVNLKALEKHAKDGDVISPAYLIGKKMVRMINGKVPQIKILGTGAITKKLVIENCAISKTAKASIEKAGGSVKI